MVLVKVEAKRVVPSADLGCQFMLSFFFLPLE